MSAEAVPTDPCEPPDRESYTFKIELNNPYVLIAVSPAAGSDNTFTWVAKRMVVLDKVTGQYTETLLSTPTPPQHIAGNEYEGTCDVKSLANSSSVPAVPDVSQNLVPVLQETKQPQKKSDTRKVHVHIQRLDHHRKTNSPAHAIRRAEKTHPSQVRASIRRQRTTRRRHVRQWSKPTARRLSRTPTHSQAAACCSASKERLAEQAR